jgi:hypothetical protein
MEPDHPRFYSDIVRHTSTRWLTVRPQGIIVAGQPTREVVATIQSHGPARTLYRHHRPVCRSLDGVTSLGRKPRQACGACPALAECTPQILVNLDLDGASYRLLLSYTNAKNFIAYLGRVRRRGVEIDDLDTRIVVMAHGYWGELSFHPVE